MLDLHWEEVAKIKDPNLLRLILLTDDSNILRSLQIGFPYLFRDNTKHNHKVTTLSKIQFEINWIHQQNFMKGEPLEYYPERERERIISYSKIYSLAQGAANYSSNDYGNLYHEFPIINIGSGLFLTDFNRGILINDILKQFKGQKINQPLQIYLNGQLYLVTHIRFKEDVLSTFETHFTRNITIQDIHTEKFIITPIEYFDLEN